MNTFLAIAVVLSVFGAIHSQTAENSDCLAIRQRLTSGSSPPPPGAFVPQCEATGFYKAKQCHGSTGLCHCVSATGQQIKAPSRGLVSCDCHRRVHETPTTNDAGQPLLGATVPTCGDDGRYAQVQCSASTGLCWCVHPDTGAKTSEPVRSRTPQC